MKKAVLFVIFVVLGITATGLIMAKAQNSNTIKNNKAASAQTEEHTNRLANSFSPYLRQHAHNPVDWYPWGAEALEKAKTENKPILISIGYSTCYWCHVLEREVFSQEDVARAMNEHFVNIKVDREVRPDIDEIYMFATHLLTSRGGWPNNVLLTPDLKPFFAVTYLPKDQWMNLVENTVDLWANKRPQLEQQADQVTAYLRQFFSGGKPMLASMPADRIAGEYFLNLQRGYDSRYGGFGAGTKFPQEPNFLFLLDYARTDNQALAMVENTVVHMMEGGIHDHVGGGFHRYATEREWKVPHFEKMLYNQGLLASVLAGLYERASKPEYKRALTRLLDFVARDMTAEDGAFYSAWDAETDAGEGDFYVWSGSELQQVLGAEDDGFLTARYGLAPLPHFPGHKHPDGEVLYQKADIKDQADWNRLDEIFAKILAVRSKRDKPLRDEKIVAAWNGMMIAGLADAGRILDDPSYIQRADKAARFILGRMRGQDGRLSRIYMDGQPHQSAFLDDYAWLAKGLMALYRATGDAYYKDQTLSLLEAADKHLLDKESGSYYLTDGGDKLPVRIRQGMDTGALPSDNAVMAQVFVDLYRATNDPQWKDRAETLVSAFSQGFAEQTGSYGHMIHALMRLNGPADVQWIEPVSAAPGKPAPAAPAQEESKDKVEIHTHILHDQSTETEKIVEITVDIENGWHLNANPASLDFLIPTVADIQTGEPSEVKITYPEAEEYTTPLGEISVYAGQAKITATVTAKQPIDEAKMRLLLQVQACKEATCYPPSQIAVNVAHDGC